LLAVKGAAHALLFLVAACGGGWSIADTKSATDSARAQMMVETICTDGGECKPSQVRALERMAFCNTESMLARHGQAIRDGGIQCQP
jgi:hypothetical protein